ncbi:MAG: hypothetical protein L3J52_09190 [Proteobacteria bacterium]|nr:hypothetical protein [Pseudomonadota bacterium]
MKNTIDIFLNQLNGITPIPKTELKKLKSISTVNHIQKGEYFLKQGEKSSDFAFVVLIRVVVTRSVVREGGSARHRLRLSIGKY